MHTECDARYTRWKEAVKRSMHWQQTSAQRTSNKDKKSKHSTVSLPLIIICTYSLQDEPISHTHTCTHAHTHAHTHTHTTATLAFTLGCVMGAVVGSALMLVLRRRNELTAVQDTGQQLE